MKAGLYSDDPYKILVAAELSTELLYQAKALHVDAERVIESAIWRLVRLLGHANSVASQQAIDVLVKIGDPAVESLIEALNTSDDNIRRFAARALGLIGSERAIEPLQAAAADETDNAVRDEVILAIERIRGSASQSVRV